MFKFNPKCKFDDYYPNNAILNVFKHVKKKNPFIKGKRINFDLPK